MPQQITWELAEKIKGKNMAINISTVRSEATNAVLTALVAMYKDADADSMKAFAEAIAEAAVVAVQNVIDHAETDVSGEGLN